jgi:lipoprotein-releasing system permease protein
MPFEFFLALRYFLSRKKRRLARATALAAVGGIGIGVGALIVAVALANGFRDEMRDKILRGTAHLTVMRTDGQTMQDYREVASRIRSLNGVISAAGTTYDGAVAIGPKGSAYAVLRGVDRESSGSAEVRNWIAQGSFEPLFHVAGKKDQPAQLNVILGAELATRIGVRLGDAVELFAAGANLSTPSKRLARIVGIFRSGLFEYDTAWVFLSLDAAGAIAGAAHAASLISVQVTDIDQVKRIAYDLKVALGNSYTTIDWQEANQPLFNALALERRMGLFIIGLIIVIAMLNITTTLILVVVERRRDIAILKAMGAAKGSITALFMIEGAIIGALGALSGVILGLVVCYVGNRYKLVSLPADVYSISNVPFRTHLDEIALAVAIAFVLSVVATIYPARAAARMHPAETLRDAG